MQSETSAVDSNNEHPCIEREQGSGRSFVVLYERESRGFAQQAGALAEALAAKARSLLVSLPLINDSNWEQQSAELETLLSEHRIRQPSCVAFSGAAVAAQSYALKDLRHVRTLVLVDATTRAHPTWTARAIGRAERSLPLGLPFRSDAAGFDSRPLLQRLRCPVLVVSSAAAGAYERSEAELLERELPTAWLRRLGGSNSDETAELCSAVLEFQDTPPRCPQRRVNQ